MSVGIATRGMICRGGSGGGDTIIAWDHGITLEDSLIEIEIDTSMELSVEITPMLEIEVNDQVDLQFVVTKGTIITGGFGTESFGTSALGDTDSEERDVYSNRLDIEINS